MKGDRQTIGYYALNTTGSEQLVDDLEIVIEQANVWLHFSIAVSSEFCIRTWTAVDM